MQASTCAANASFSSMRSMSASLSPARSRALAVAGTGPMPMVRGGTPATDQRHQPGQRPQPEPLGVAPGGSRRRRDAPSFWPLALPAVTVASGSGPAHDRTQLAEHFERAVRPRVLVGVDDDVALAARHGHRHDLVGEPARLLRRDRPLVGAQRELVLLLARDAVFLRRFSAVSIIPPGTGKFSPPAVTRPRAARRAASVPVAAYAPAHVRRVERRLAHALGAARQHQVARPGLDLHRRVDQRLHAEPHRRSSCSPGT